MTPFMTLIVQILVIILSNAYSFLNGIKLQLVQFNSITQLLKPFVYISQGGHFVSQQDLALDARKQKSLHVVI